MKAFLLSHSYRQEILPKKHNHPSEAHTYKQRLQ